MAGGPNAAVAACLRCAEAAHRVREGLETDTFACASCGFQFTVNFDECEPSEPLWPLTPEQRAAILAAAERRRGRKG